MDIEHRQELFEQYEQEMRLQIGFGHPSRWGDGPRNFAAFMANEIALDICPAVSDSRAVQSD